MELCACEDRYQPPEDEGDDNEGRGSPIHVTPWKQDAHGDDSKAAITRELYAWCWHAVELMDMWYRMASAGHENASMHRHRHHACTIAKHEKDSRVVLSCRIALPDTCENAFATISKWCRQIVTQLEDKKDKDGDARAKPRTRNKPSVTSTEASGTCLWEYHSDAALGTLDRLVANQTDLRFRGLRKEDSASILPLRIRRRLSILLARFVASTTARQQSLHRVKNIKWCIDAHGSDDYVDRIAVQTDEQGSVHIAQYRKDGRGTSSASASQRDTLHIHVAWTDIHEHSVHGTRRGDHDHKRKTEETGSSVEPLHLQLWKGVLPGWLDLAAGEDGDNQNSNSKDDDDRIPTSSYASNDEFGDVQQRLDLHIYHRRRHPRWDLNRRAGSVGGIYGNSHRMEHMFPPVIPRGYWTCLLHAVKSGDREEDDVNRNAAGVSQYPAATMDSKEEKQAATVEARRSAPPTRPVKHDKITLLHVTVSNRVAHIMNRRGDRIQRPRAPRWHTCPFHEAKREQKHAKQPENHTSLAMESRILICMWLALMAMETAMPHYGRPIAVSILGTPSPRSSTSSLSSTSTDTLSEKTSIDVVRAIHTTRFMVPCFRDMFMAQLVGVSVSGDPANVLTKTVIRDVPPLPVELSNCIEIEIVNRFGCLLSTQPEFHLFASRIRTLLSNIVLKRMYMTPILLPSSHESKSGGGGGGGSVASASMGVDELKLEITTSQWLFIGMGMVSTSPHESSLLPSFASECGFGTGSCPVRGHVHHELHRLAYQTPLNVRITPLMESFMYKTLKCVPMYISPSMAVALYGAQATTIMLQQHRAFYNLSRTIVSVLKSLTPISLQDAMERQRSSIIYWICIYYKLLAPIDRTVVMDKDKTASSSTTTRTSSTLKKSSPSAIAGTVGSATPTMGRTHLRTTYNAEDDISCDGITWMEQHVNHVSKHLYFVKHKDFNMAMARFAPPKSSSYHYRVSTMDTMPASFTTLALGSASPPLCTSPNFVFGVRDGRIVRSDDASLAGAGGGSPQADASIKVHISATDERPCTWYISDVYLEQFKTMIATTTMTRSSSSMDATSGGGEASGGTTARGMQLAHKNKTNSNAHLVDAMTSISGHHTKEIVAPMIDSPASRFGGICISHSQFSHLTLAHRTPYYKLEPEGVPLYKRSLTPLQHTADSLSEDDTTYVSPSSCVPSDSWLPRHAILQHSTCLCKSKGTCISLIKALLNSLTILLIPTTVDNGTSVAPTVDEVDEENYALYKRMECIHQQLRDQQTKWITLWLDSRHQAREAWETKQLARRTAISMAKKPSIAAGTASSASLEYVPPSAGSMRIPAHVSASIPSPYYTPSSSTSTLGQGGVRLDSIRDASLYSSTSSWTSNGTSHALATTTNGRGYDDGSFGLYSSDSLPMLNSPLLPLTTSVRLTRSISAPGVPLYGGFEHTGNDVRYDSTSTSRLLASGMTAPEEDTPVWWNSEQDPSLPHGAWEEGIAANDTDRDNKSDAEDEKDEIVAAGTIPSMAPSSPIHHSTIHPSSYATLSPVMQRMQLPLSSVRLPLSSASTDSFSSLSAMALTTRYPATSLFTSFDKEVSQHQGQHPSVGITTVPPTHDALYSSRAAIPGENERTQSRVTGLPVLTTLPSLPTHEFAR